MFIFSDTLLVIVSVSNLSEFVAVTSFSTRLVVVIGRVWHFVCGRGGFLKLGSGGRGAGGGAYLCSIVRLTDDLLVGRGFGGGLAAVQASVVIVVLGLSLSVAINSRELGVPAGHVEVALDASVYASDLRMPIVCRLVLRLDAPSRV